MTDFAAKKLGEALAFGKIGIDTLEQGFEGFRKLFTEVRLEDLKKANSSHIDSIMSIAAGDTLKKTEDKAEATAEKLKAMRNLYVKDAWDNPTELCEWLGFFEGAAVVHWTLIKGVAEALGNKPMELLADQAVLFHEEILKTVSLSLYNIGKEKNS